MPVAAALLTAGQAASTATPATAVISPTAGRPVLLAVAAHPAGGPVQPTASGAGLTWTVVRYNSYDPTNSGETLTVFIGAGTPAAGAVTIDFGGQTQVEVVWGITELTGADTVGTIVQSVPAQGNSATALATLSAMTAGNATMAFAAVGSLGWQPLPGAGFAALHTTRGTGGVGIGLLSEWRADTDTSADASLAVADPWGIVAVEIKAAAASGQTLLPDADLSAGAWTPVGSASLFGALADADAGTYAKTDANSTAEIGLQPGVTPQAGAQTFTYEASGRPHSALLAGVYDGAALVEQWLVDPLPAALTQYVRTLATPMSSLADVRLRFAAQDAAAPPSANVTFGAIGTGANGSTTVLPSYPAGITAGQYLTLHVSSGGTSSPTPTTPSGWTLLATGASTDGTFGIDTGPRRMTVFGKVADGTETGTLSVSITGGDTCRGTIIRWVASSPTDVWDVVGQGANDSTSGTGFSATTAAISWQPGDAAIAAVGQRVDSATQSAQSLTAAGITFGARTNRASTAVTTGNDHRHVVDTFAPVSAGTATVATTWAYTASASVSGGLVVVRLRCNPPTERARVYSAQFEAPGVGGQQIVAVAQVSETDLAQALAATHVRGTAQAAESDQPQSINVSQPLTAGQATETDSAQTLAASQTAAVASASEADSAQSLVVAQAISVAQAVESDAAQEITALGVTVVQQASETGTAQPIAGRHVVAVTQSAEQDTAQSITRSINITVNQANESNAAQAITGVQPATLSAVGEFDAAQPIAIGGFAIIDQVLEFNVAHPITPIIFHTQTSLVDAGGGLKPKRRVRRSVLPIAALFRPKPEEEERVRLAPIPDAMIDAIVAASLAPVDPWAKAREEEAELMRLMEEHA